MVLYTQKKIAKTNKMSPIASIFREFIKKYHRLEIIGTENIPDGSAIIAPNHSGAMDWDTVCLSCALERWIHILYWDKYYHAPVWGDFIRNFNVIPLSLERGLDEDMRKLLREGYFREGKLVGIFPEGTSATLFEGYRIGRFYPGVIRLAELSGTPIIPTAIVGVAEAAPLLFYAAGDARGIRDPPFALPVLFPVKIKIRFGEPVFWQSETKTKEEYYKAAEEIRREVVKLVQRTLK